MRKTEDNTKVAVGMSGGVDSSVAAALLKEQGYQVCGVTMQTWNGGLTAPLEPRHGCCGPGEEEDIEDAQNVARTLGFPLHVLDMRQEYENEVLDYFRQEYLAGRTPNPCFRCNRRIKFDGLLARSREYGIEFDFFATGHYARIKHDPDSRRYLLKKARDTSKDQSYFLASLSQEQLSHSLFPLGDYTKEAVRKIALELGLKVKNKPDSQDFISGGYQSLFGKTEAGRILDGEGNVLGEHRGISGYTIGQRRGLGIAAREPLYVTAIDAEENTVRVGFRNELYQDSLVAGSLNWIAIDDLKEPARLMARIRSAQNEVPATVTPLGEDMVHVTFSEPQMAITPGQVVVFYRGDTVVGSGIIESTKEE
ncbi:MAG: tRNA 2-thiouridine(34) synthase MnmA [Dehalococcoidales bacterium]|nr:MAG: tRNA 2-thiouridine(34) synthase MnmA [Dehalococcoidales bacterium]